MVRILCGVVVMLFMGCKEAPKQQIEESRKTTEPVEIMRISAPAAAMNKVFEAHGGLANWKKNRTLSFTLPKTSPETHTIDLYSRHEKIETSEMAMGFDGKDFWLLDEKKSYKGDPIFYHNLMFYFYAMPFVLADKGIVYSETADLEFEGKKYPGVRITFKDGVGVSSKDEYYLHYEPETHQMTWLGYTVTYRSGEKSDNVKWIRYNDWGQVDGVLLPRSITWHDYEGRTIKEPREPTLFEDVVLQKTAKNAGFYSMPENAKVVTKTP